MKAFITAKKFSNKGKTPAFETSGPLPEPTEPQLSATHHLPFIDKISLVVTPPEEVEAHEIYNTITTYADEPDVFVNAGSKAKWGKFKFAKRIPLSKAPVQPLFQAHLDKGTKQALAFRLEFNPRKLGQEGLGELHATLTCLMDGGWGYVIKHGKITRLDVAVDLPSTRPGAFAVLPQQGLSEHFYAVNGKLETLYLGKSKGNQTAVYNKKKQRLSQGQAWTTVSMDASPTSSNAMPPSRRHRRSGASPRAS